MYTLYVDFAKAFDKVSHAILRESSIASESVNICYSSSGLNYTKRYQCVKILGLLSSALPITSGVPQGSNLGPLLFIIFVNDLPDSIKSSYLRMFADDTKISNTNILALEQDGKNPVHWASKNEMIFNTDKTVFFSVLYCEVETSFNEFRLSTSKVCEVYLTPELSFYDHLKRKLGHLNSLLIRLKRELPVSVGSQVKMVLFKSYFLSSFFYKSQIWYPSQKIPDKLELFHKRATQWILDIKDYHQRLRALKLFPISYQLQMADLKFLNKLLNERHEFDVTTIINTKRPSTYDLRMNNLGLFEKSETRLNESDEQFRIRACIMANRLENKTSKLRISMILHTHTTSHY